jgi:formate hydrogenlyase transcriptional activator
MAYSWPGNVRELQNIIERAFVLSAGPVLSLGRDLLPDSAPQARAEASPFHAPSTSAHPGFPREAAAAPSPARPRPAALDDIQKQHILSVLGQTAWVIEGPSGAAKVLSLHPNTLRSRMKKLGIQRPSHEIS